MVDEPVGGDGAPPGQEQGGQQGADLGVTDPDGLPVVGPHRQWPEHPETHALTVALRGGPPPPVVNLSPPVAGP
ncbi:hypothetical protein GCM10027590_09100 [Nocardiopsis nanhaiensis]